jgi:HEAT repeat protein
MKRYGCLFMLATMIPGLGGSKRATDRQADEADAIVVGEVQSGRQNGRALFFTLNVLRVLKGNALSGGIVNVRSNSAWPPANTDLSGDFGIWFLKTAADSWELLPFRRNGLDESPVIIGLFRQLSSTANPEPRFVGLSGLVRAHDIQALAELAEHMDDIPNLTTSEFALGAIRSLRDPSPANIQALARFAASSKPSVQRSAAEALAYLHTRQTLPIVAMLLDSSDAAARASAIKGLSRFVDNLPMPTDENVRTLKALHSQGPTPYRTPETDRLSLSRRALDPSQEPAYLQFWKSWWAQVRNELTSK